MDEKPEETLEELNIRRLKELEERADKVEETAPEQLERLRFEDVCDIRYTREQILKGTEFREKVGVSELGEGRYLVIRPITDAEFIEVQNIILGDATVSAFSSPEAKVTDMINRKQKGEYLALSYALTFDDEKWTPKDVGKLPAGVPDKLYERLALISGFPRPPTPETSAESSIV